MPRRRTAIGDFLPEYTEQRTKKLPTSTIIRWFEPVFRRLKQSFAGAYRSQWISTHLPPDAIRNSAIPADRGHPVALFAPPRRPSGDLTASGCPRPNSSGDEILLSRNRTGCAGLVISMRASGKKLPTVRQIHYRCGNNCEDGS